MDQLFYWILNMAIVGSILGIVVLLLRRIKKLPKNFIYAMYSMVAIRLLCPVGIINGFSFLNLLPKGSVVLVNPGTGEVIQDENLALTNMIQAAQSYQPLQFRDNGWKIAYQIGSVIWCIITCCLLFIVLGMYFHAKKEMNKAKWLQDNIYQSDKAVTPQVIGIFHPRILLPVYINDNQDNIKFILAHENTHIRKHDNLWRMLAIILSCIYWFLPLSWILLRDFLTDMELACDETTIRAFTRTERKEYATALLSMAHGKTSIYSSAFASHGIRLRIQRIMEYKRLTVLSVIALSLLFGLFILCFLSNK